MKLLTITLLISVSAFADADFLNKPRFHIQLGLTNMNFFDGYGFNASGNNRILSVLYPKFNYSINYKIKKKSSIGLSHQFYTLGIYYSLRGQSEILGSQNGDLLGKSKRIIGLNYFRDYSFSIKNKLQLYLSPSVSVVYTTGSDQIFLYAYPGGFDFASVGVENESFGLGIGTEIGLIAYNRFSLSAALIYYYIFEKGKYEEYIPEYYKYTPSRHVLSFQPKIGYLF